MVPKGLSVGYASGHWRDEGGRRRAETTSPSNP